MNNPDKIQQIAERHPTPFYLYDQNLLSETLDTLLEAASVNRKFRVHYALKACAERGVIDLIRKKGLGLDTVSGGEIELGLKAGFAAEKILFAGVGKTDSEIDLALKSEIGCFNVESLPELQVISERAIALNRIARVALRINPEIDAHTHHYITTGLAENKFGINMSQLDRAIDMAMSLPNIDFQGLHFHIGSQITIMEPFRILCERINKVVNDLDQRNVPVRSINVGGGLAIDYDHPEQHPIPDFKAYFDTFNSYLDTTNIDEVHFELGRAIVGQCGSLVTRVVFVKEGDTRTFVIVDAGMTELIRPALYGARHPITNITGELRGASMRTVDVVGPVCESADEFGKDYRLADPRRGDVLVIGCAGAYGNVMASNYNGRTRHDSILVIKSRFDNKC